MTRSSLFFAFLIAAISSHLFAGREAMEVVAIEVVGSERTSLDWVKDYIGIELPIYLTPLEVNAIKNKLLNTDVFTKVEVALRPEDSLRETYDLVISLEEKWTLIPVIRGTFGGGTPLIVIGGYEKHAFGSLWTIGAEARKYGNAAPGGVIWARAPRWRDGYYLLGVEVWRDNRIRSIYNHDDKEIGTFRTDGLMARILYLAPFDKSVNPLITKTWQYGFDLTMRKQNQSVFNPKNDEAFDAYSNHFAGDSDTTTLTSFLGQLVYDDILTLSRMSVQGTRFVASYGPVLNSQSYAADTLAELELFYHRLLPADLNFAYHLLVGSATDKTLQSQYFLGGFNSIRGLPDGALRGNKASYMNIELRRMMISFPSLWIEGVVFADTGGASQHWEDFNDSIRASSGVGIRFAIPQIYRMVFRLDYAWSLDNPGQSGISAGMNQFFEAYRPL